MGEGACCGGEGGGVRPESGNRPRALRTGRPSFWGNGEKLLKQRGASPSLGLGVLSEALTQLLRRRLRLRWETGSGAAPRN